MRAAVALLALSLGACVHLRALTPPPLGGVAVLDDEAEVLRVSVGAALAFECVGCDDARATTDRPAVARVYTAYLDRLDPGWDPRGPQPLDAFVVVGLRPGKTTLRIRAAHADDEYEVEVVE